MIRCTKKLQKEMGLKATDLAEQESAPGLLGSWHANLLFIDRRKCVLFVNDRTLFNFIIPDVNSGQIRQLDTLFGDFLQCILAEEGFSETLCRQILQEYETIGFANTNNRSVLGSMNDLAFHYQFQIQREGGVNSAMVPSIIHDLNRMPMGALGYDFAIDALRRVYGLQKIR